MFIVTWFAVLIVIPGVLFTTFIIWLVHSLDGYPAFIVSQANRDARQFPATRLAPGRSALLNALANRQSIRARPELWANPTAARRTYDYHRTE
jgi:hypothetical protein